MAVTVERPGPYTSPKVVVDLVQRHRSRGLPNPIDPETLGRVGVSESLIPRTLQSLVALDLIEENGRITDTFEGLRLAPEAEFQGKVKEWLDAAYADVLQFADPATDGETAVRDAFRSYKPVGQQDRMVSLFLRLYEMAGVGTAKADEPRPRLRPVTAVARVREVAKAPKVSTLHAALSSGTRATAGAQAGAIPPAILGLLQSLPLDGKGWSAERQEGFLTAFAGVVRFCFPAGEVVNPVADGNE